MAAAGPPEAERFGSDPAAVAGTAAGVSDAVGLPLLPAIAELATVGADTAESFEPGACRASDFAVGGDLGSDRAVPGGPGGLTTPDAPCAEAAEAAERGSCCEGAAEVSAVSRGSLSAAFGGATGVEVALSSGGPTFAGAEEAETPAADDVAAGVVVAAEAAESAGTLLLTVGSAPDARSVGLLWAAVPAVTGSVPAVVGAPPRVPVACTARGGGEAAALGTLLPAAASVPFAEAACG